MRCKPDCQTATKRDPGNANAFRNVYAMKHVAIEGVIGAGKTTVARLIAARTDAVFLGETADTHPFVDAFYSDPPRYALETELGFLLIHYHQLFLREPGSVVADFSLAK